MGEGKSSTELWNSGFFQQITDHSSPTHLSTPYYSTTHSASPHQQRHKLDQSKLTPLTKESFAQWKKTRQNKKDAEADALKAAKSSNFAMGKANGMSGRDLFTFDSSIGQDDSGDEGEDEDDWDLHLLRIRTEKEERAAEIER